MPRIPDGALEGIIYLYPSVSDAKSDSRLGGSGFFVMDPSTVIPGQGILYAVTNAHVIEAGNTVIRLNTRDGQADVFDFTERHWLLHPDKDDIAICAMPELDPSLHAYKEINPGMLLKRHEIDAFRVGPGDDVFVVGRFINSQGKLRNIPSVRFGNIAQMPLEPIEQGRVFGEFQQESFLVEARSISGFSGSPVFLILLAASSRQEPGFRLHTDVFRLLGVQWGYIQDWEPVRDFAGRSVDTGLKVRLNTGMMGVVPAWKLGDLLRSDVLMEHRRKTEEEYIKKHGLPKTSLAESPESDANQLHREDFKRLVDVAARKRPQSDQT
jgi:hypothetical protein